MSVPQLPLLPEQLDQLPPDIKDILLQYVNDQNVRFDDMRGKYERLRVDSEQKYFELERQQVADHSRLETEAKAATELRWQVSDLERKYNETSEKYRELQSKYFSKSEYWTEQEQTLLSAKGRLETEKFDLTELLDKRNREVDRLTAEWKQMSERLDDAIKGRITSQNEAGEAKSELAIIQHREGRLQQEMENVTQQNEWLNNELQRKIQELMNNRKDKSSRLMELQGQLDDITAEAEHHRTSLEAARNMNTNLSEQIEQYTQKLKDARDGNAQLEEQYRNELIAQEKLLELYKVSSEEAEAKVTEMTKAVDELQKLLKQATHVYNELQSEREEDKCMSQELISERDAKIERMEKELTNANELLEVSRQHERQLTCHDDAEIVSSAAASVSRLIKSGMTLTQIYSEYVQVCSTLQTQKDENKRLSDYLDRILHEIEEKAPVLKKQKHDYENCLESVTRLTHQLDSAMVDYERCRVSSEDDRRRCAELSRENERHKQQTFDLGRQVRMLLRELEEARGTVVRMPGDDNDSMDVSSSSAVITSQLVTFKSIEELHEQNQKLLGVVRELSNDQELRETETRDSKIASLQQQLNDAAAQIEEMKSDRRRQTEMVESLVQQRDMYRTLATQPALTSPRAAPVPVPVTPVASTPPPAATPAVTVQMSERELAALEDTKNSLKELQEEFAVYRREKSENERLLNEQLDKLSKESTSMRVQNARLASQLDFTGERLKVMQSNAESSHTEVELLRDKNTKFIASLARHQETISKLQEDLISTQDKLTHADVRCQSLAAEKERLRSTEARLTSENEMLHRNQQTRDQLVISLQAIQNNLERSEFETKTRLTRQIEKLDRENAVLRQKADGTDGEQRAFVITLERQLGEAKQEVERERTKLSCTVEQLTTAQEHIAHLKEELSAAESKLQAAQSKLANTETSQRDESSDKRLEHEVQRYRDLLDEANQQISSLQGQLTQAEQHATQYKSIADSVECSLREQTEAHEQFRQTLEARVAETVQANEALEGQVKQLEATVANLSSENSSLVKENAALVEEKANRIAEVRQSDTATASQLSSLRKTLEETENRLQEALSNEGLARRDCQRQLEEAKTAKQNYERELLLHATDIENLAQVKLELESFGDKVEEAKADAREARNTLTSSEASWVEREQSLKVEMDKLKDKAADLQAQNSALHQELERMSAQMLQLQSHEERHRDKMQQFADTVDSSSAEQPSSSEQLLDVVRYLRREKELAEARFEVIQAETSRLRQQVINLKKQADAAEQALIEERQKTEVNLQTAAQHAELMRKVETLNLLQDSNHLLRDERNRLSARLHDIEAKAQQLEAELSPLQDECRDAVAQRDSLQKEVELLRSETDRWKARTNHLIEQCNKFDPEEHKRAIEERDEAKKQLSSVMEETHKHRAELSRVNSLLRSSQSECEQQKQQIQSLNDELTTAKSDVATKDTKTEELNSTIAQLRKIGRKYRMQAEEVQKELEEVKTKNAAAEQTSQSDAVALHERLESTEKERDDVTTRLGSAEYERNEALKEVKELEQRSKELHEKLDTVIKECTKVTNENSELSDEVKKLTVEKEKDVVDHSRLETENASLTEEKRKLLLMLQTAKQRFVALRTDKESLESTCAELKRQLEAAAAEKESAPPPSNEPGEQVEAVRAEMQSAVTRLETEVAELQQSRQSLQHDNAQQLESLERLRRDNTELQQRVHLLQNQLELANKQVAASPAKPTMSAPPVERTAASDAASEQHAAPRKANIRPIASQQPHIRSVQPVRSSATETRAMASIRPMSASVISSVSSVSTPMATVMPTTAAVSDSGEGVSLIMPSAVQSVASVSQAGRPTQQVQPVSSHFEEATVSSSEEQSAMGGITAHWWHVDATPSTSSERDGSSAASSGVGKRPRDDGRSQEEAGQDISIEAPSKRSKTSGEVADTTELSNGSGPVLATVAAGTESEREAASVAQVEVEPCIKVRRETEPVTTSLSTEEHSHASDNAQDEDVRAAMAERAAATQYGGHDLPDYQDAGETAAGEFDIRPSTSRSGEGTPMSDEPRDDSAEAGTVDDYQQAESVSVDDEVDEDEDDDDVILVEVDDDDGDGEMGEGGYSDDVGGNVMDDYQQSADDDESDLEQEVVNEDYIVDESDDFDITGEIERSDIPYEGDESFEGELSEDASQDRDQDDNDDLVVVDAAAADHCRAQHSSIISADDDHTAAGVEPQQVTTTRQTVSTSAAVRFSHSSTESHLPTSSQHHYQQQQPRHISASVSTTRYPHITGPTAAVTSRTQLMPFILGSEAGSGYELGDDGIVPSTPTLQVPQRPDGFAEAVCSPQVRNERFMFIGSSDTLPHSQLAHQEGIGVDDTRMDLSQFDQSGRSVTSTPQSPSQPDIVITAADQQELEQAPAFSEGIESADVVPTGEAAVGFSEPTVSRSVEGAVTGVEEAEQVEDIAVERSRVGQRTTQEEPSTSSGVQIDRASQQSHEVSQAQSKPKIQRIVWEEDRNVASASPSSGGVVQVMSLLPGSSDHHAHRGFSRTPMQSYRGQQPRHAARPMMQPSVMRQRAPGGLQVPRQVARRARGRSPGAQRQQQFY